jgi:hypothetical protein
MFTLLNTKCQFTVFSRKKGKIKEIMVMFSGSPTKDIDTVAVLW